MRKFPVAAVLVTAALLLLAFLFDGLLGEIVLWVLIIGAIIYIVLWFLPSTGKEEGPSFEEDDGWVQRSFKSLETDVRKYHFLGKDREAMKLLNANYLHDVGKAIQSPMVWGAFVANEKRRYKELYAAIGKTMPADLDDLSPSSSLVTTRRKR